MTDKIWKKKLGSKPQFVSWEDKEKRHYPSLFEGLPAEKRSEDILTRFTKLCNYIKLNSMNDNELKDVFPPTCMVVERDSQVWIFEIRSIDGHSPLELVNPVARALNPNMFVVIGESWTVMLEKDEKYEYGNVHKDPNRKECIVIDGRTREGKKHTMMQLVERKDGLVKFTDMDDLHGKADKIVTRYDDPLEK